MSAGPDGPGYTGHVNDPDTGFVYMQQRYYDPDKGGFLSADPLGPSEGNVFNFGRYDYASNNPILNIDPDGRDDCRVAGNCKERLAAADQAVLRDSKLLVHVVLGPIASLADLAHGPATGNNKETSDATEATMMTAVVPEIGEIKAVVTVVDEVQEVSTVVKTADAVAQSPRYARGALRQQVLDKGRQADGSVRCAYCGKSGATTADHVLAHSKGGPTTIENLEPACVSCNSSKGAKDLGTQWVPR
jgi:RHS repeat-associated protein